MTLHAADLEYSPYDGLPVGWPHEQGVKSLGYEVLGWTETYLAQPDGDEAGRAWAWRETQARFVAWWYALDENGEFLFIHGQIVLSKGSGKSPMAAILSCAELGGPVVFSHWDEDGDPVGRPHPSPDVWLAAVSFEQTSNMSDLLASALNEGDAHEVIADLDPGIMRTRSANGGIWRAAAGDRSLEGKRMTAAFLDETQHWITGNRGVALARVIRRNLMKTGGRAVELTNCWEPGEESVAETTWRNATSIEDRSETGIRSAKRTLRWHPHIHVEDLSDETALRAALNQLYEDFPWVPIERFIDEAQSDMGAAEIRRFFLNEISSADDALITDSEWDACLVPADEWRPLQAGDTITLGFDGGKTDDSTVLVACRIEDRTFHLLHIQEKSQTDKKKAVNWEVNREVVDFHVQDALKTYDVAAFYGDVRFWESYIDKWGKELKGKVSIQASANSVIGWDMRGRLQASTRANEALVSAILDCKVGHNGDPTMRRHVLNTRRRHNTYGLYFGKESRESPKKIDVYAGMLLADMARGDFVQSGKVRKRKGKVIVWS